MNPIVRNILAIVAGAVTNTVVVTLVEMLSIRLFPLPADAGAPGTTGFETAIQTFPPTAFALVLGGILVAVFLSGLVAGKLAATPKRIVLVVGLLLVAANVANAWAFWHPTWFRIAAVLLPFPLVWLGGRLGAGERTSQV